MKQLLSMIALLAGSSAGLFGGPCLPGTLQGYIDLGTNGCQSGSVQFSNFMSLDGQNIATLIDPNLVQVSPGGTSLNPTLLFSLDSSAMAGEVFESNFRFLASGTLGGVSITLDSANAAGDGAVTGVLDVCPGGSFMGGVPAGCPNAPATAAAFVIAQAAMLSGFRDVPVSSFFDVFVDLTIDGGSGGSANLGSASVGVATVPEPSAALLIVAGLGLIGIFRARRAR